MVTKNRWAQAEFGGAHLGDQRLNKRLVLLAQQRRANPQGSIAQSCGSLAGTRAAYRFYDNPEVQVEQIQAPHRQASLRRAESHRVVLAIQDTTQVNLTAHPHTAGVGYLQDLQHTGFLLHTTLLVTPHRDPLGVVQQQVWVRDPADFGKRAKRKERPIEDKESQKWLTSLSAVAELQKELPHTQLVSVGDSEADIYALFAQAESLGQAFLVRACRDRVLPTEQERHLWRRVAQPPAGGTLEVAVPRQADRPARTAILTLRWVAVSLPVPQPEKAHQAVKQVQVWAIWAREETLPEGVSDRLDWKLLTNVPTDTLEQAAERVGWYAGRWVVEMFHRVLKSGCRLEERQFDDLANTQRFLAVDSVVAWQVLAATLHSRVSPQVSCEALLETYEWQALSCFIHKTQRPPEQAPTLEEAIGWIARLGGFTASRKHAPGTTVLWRGFSRLTDIAQAWLVFHPDP